MSLQYFFVAALFVTNSLEKSLDVSTSIVTSGNATSTSDISPEMLLSRRRGLIPKFRRRGDAFLQPLQTLKVKKLWNSMLEKNKVNTEKHKRERVEKEVKDFIHYEDQNSNRNSSDVKGMLHRNMQTSLVDNVENRRPQSRRRRWDYDENYDWENGGKDYVIPGQEARKETKFEKFAKSWQKHALKVIFLFSFVCMICCCCLAICKTFCCKLCETICWHLKDYRDICLNRDPTWRKARKYADEYGIKIDYDQYKRIKTTYEEGFQRQGHDEYKDLSGR